MALALVKPTDSFPPDTEMVERIIRGERQAFVMLMRRNNQRLYRVARSILRNESDAEEAVQEAYYQAYKCIEQFRGESGLSTWLVRIVINASNQRARKNLRTSSFIVFTDEIDEGSHSGGDLMDKDPTSLPEQALLRAQTRRLLESRIDQLPDAFRSVFILRAVEGLSVEETASCLDIPPATVRTRYFRARKTLQAIIMRDFGASLGDTFAFAGERCNRIVARVLERLDDERQ